MKNLAGFHLTTKKIRLFLTTKPQRRAIRDDTTSLWRMRWVKILLQLTSLLLVSPSDRQHGYYIYPKSWDPLTPYNTCPKIWTKPFLVAHLNNVQEELLYYPWRWRWRRSPQMLKFSLKFLRPHYFLTLSLIWFIFGMMIHISPKFCPVPSPPL